MTVNFPTRREDQSFSIAARFSLSDTAVLPLVKACVLAWVRANQTWYRIWRSNVVEVEELEFQAEFLSEPRLEQLAGAGCFTLVFDCKPSSTRWKDWIVRLIDDLCKCFPEARFEQFES